MGGWDTYGFLWCGVCSSFVHVVMYFYYLLRTLDVPVPRVIKKNITNLQILQVSESTAELTLRPSTRTLLLSSRPPSM